MARPCVIFDLDDTLIHTQELYDKAIDRFETVMYREGFQPREAREHMLAINVELAQQNGALPSNFGSAMAQTYYDFCRGLETYYNRRVTRELRAIGDGIYTATPALYDDAEEAVSALRETHSLILCTAGDPAIQQRKIDALPFASAFEHAYAVAKKNERTFHRIMYECDLSTETTWMVGNSARSDINPASTAGMRCFWLDRGTWAFDNEPLRYPQRVWKITQLLEVVHHLRVLAPVA